MKRTNVEKIVLQMTSSGLKIVKLAESQVPKALEKLSKGEQAPGDELDIIPEHARLMAYCLRRLGKGWMLLDTDDGPTDLTESTLETPLMSESVEKALREIAAGLMAQDSKVEPHHKLQQRMKDFLDDSRELDKLFEEIKLGVGHQLGEVLAYELLNRMGIDENFCWKCWGERNCTCEMSGSGSGRADLDVYDARAKAEPGTGGSGPGEIGTRLPELSIILPHCDNFSSDEILALERRLRRLRLTYFRETGFQIPELELRLVRSGKRLKEKDFVFARRRRTIHRSEFSSLEGEDMVETVVAEFEELVRRNGHEWLTIHQVAKRIQEIRPDHWGLIEEFKDAGGTLRDLVPLLREVLEADCSILDLVSILETWLKYPEEERLQAILDSGKGEVW